jgi:hypothetical protein
MSEAIVVSPRSGLNFIEQLQNFCLTECVKVNRPFLTGVSDMAKIAMLTRPNCKCWDCPSCAARNARRWIARVINHVNKADTVNGWFMFTVTAHEKWRGDASSVKNLRQGWKKLYNRMRYEFGVSQYTKVWEMHADKTFHLHGLIDSVMEERWLKDNARECGMGYQVDLHHVDNAGQVAGYICKYFLKSQSEIAEDRLYPRNLRRIEVSRNWLQLPQHDTEKMFSWLLHKSRSAQLRAADWYESNNFQIIDTVEG